MNTSTKEQVEVPQVFSAITAAIMGKQKILNLSAVFCKNIQVQHSMCGLYGSFLMLMPKNTRKIRQILSIVYYHFVTDTS